MPTKLTEVQLALLQAGAQREDRCIPSPNELRGAAAKKSTTKLIEEGLAREINAKQGFPIWRIEGSNGQAKALKLTAAGFKIVSAPSGQGAEAKAEALTKEQNVEQDAQANRETKASGKAASATMSIPRGGSKLAAVVTLLQREGGASIDELVKATDWLPHTTRAALTGLRKRGMRIERMRADEGKQPARELVHPR